MRIDPLLTWYPVRLRYITVCVIIGIAAVFYVFPRFLGESAKITHQSISEKIETINIPQTEQVKIPEPPSRPSIPVASDEEFEDEDITIEDMDFEDFEDWETPPPPSESSSSVRFIPYDKAPEIIGGWEALQRYVVYPDIAMEAGIEGTIIVQAFIDINGNVGETIILKGIPNTGLNEAAIAAVKRTKWKPALQRAKKVGFWLSIPITFDISSE